MRTIKLCFKVYSLIKGYWVLDQQPGRWDEMVGGSTCGIPGFGLPGSENRNCLTLLCFGNPRAGKDLWSFAANLKPYINPKP